MWLVMVVMTVIIMGGMIVIGLMIMGMGRVSPPTLVTEESQKEQTP